MGLSNLPPGVTDRMIEEQAEPPEMTHEEWLESLGDEYYREKSKNEMEIAKRWAEKILKEAD